MKIKFLGTAAAEGYPAIFCKCENCQKALAAGGRNIRSRSQALVNGNTLIDFPCDTYHHMLEHKIDLTDVNHCLITHTHFDHFYLEEFNYLNTINFSHPGENWPGITIYGSKDIIPAERFFEPTHGICRTKIVEPFTPFKVGDLTVTALKARHGTPNPYFYLITDKDKTLLYAHDTGLFPEETINYLKQIKPHFDLVSLDCTEGDMEELPYNSHMCFGWDIKCRDMFYDMGLADQKTIFVLNHFSHNGRNSVYDEFSKKAEKEGFITSYDGLEISF